MKPIDLSPSKAAGKSAGPRVATKIDVVGVVVSGGIVALMVGVGVFFLWGQTTSKVQQAEQTEKATEDLRAQSLQITSQIQQAGVKKDYSAAADAAVQSLLTTAQTRIDQAQIGREIRALMPPDMWFTTMKVGGDAAAAGSGGDLPITIEGVAKNIDISAAFKQRLNASPLIKDAEITENQWAPERGDEWVSFKLVAKADASGGSGSGSSSSTGDGQLASDQSGGTAGGGVALEPTPNFGKKSKKTGSKQKKPAAPATGFDKLIGGGGSK